MSQGHIQASHSKLNESGPHTGLPQALMSQGHIQASHSKLNESGPHTGLPQ